MLKLSDFFQPLNFQTLAYFLLLFLSFDVFGTFIKKTFIKYQKEDETRILNWIIGLGAFVFIWFILGFFVAPKGNPVLYSIPLLLAISLSSYVKEKKYLELPKVLWSLKVPILIILPFLPAVFVKASLPPYYSDEMAYHFLSPSDIKQMGVWAFNGGLYQNVPRLFDTFFILTFSITRTYSIVRLFHFSILATSMIFAYMNLKKNFGFLVGLLFFFAFFSIPDEIVFVSTLGYVDIATISFMLIGFLMSIDYLVNTSSKSLIISSIFWAMALGTKYTPITAILSFSVPLLAIIIKNGTKFSEIFRPNFLFKILLSFLVFGGYWYIKNFVVYANPIYPFIFPCVGKYAADCSADSSFFTAWTVPVTFSNISVIMGGLFPGNKILQSLILITPIFIFFNKNKKIKRISLLILASIMIEFLVLKKFSGFYARYHQHLQFWMLVLLAIQLANEYKNKLLYVLFGLCFLALTYSLVLSYVKTVRYTDSLKFLNWDEINYSIGRSNIYDWVRQKLPGMAEAARWCENGQGGEFTPIARFDPDMIWYQNDGFIRSFLVNCYWGNPNLGSTEWSDIIKPAKDRKLKFWTITPNPCLPKEQVKSKTELQDTNNNAGNINQLLLMRRLNNSVVCNSQQVLPNLYYFDYQKLPFSKN